MTAEAPSQIYFSDFFSVRPEVLEEYGAFDVSLINDLPLFIDPFLLFNNTDPDYQALHEQIITYLKFLRDKSVAGKIDNGLLEAWFTFREVRENWLGYSLNGNGGSGLGMDFAIALNANLNKVFADFGNEKISHSSHLEKVCLVTDRVGKDNISDFATNLIKDYLLQYTERFAKQHLRPNQIRRVQVKKCRFNYETETWKTGRYDLPYVNEGYVILTPIDLLTMDEVWINKVDLLRDYTQFANAISDQQLRSQVNNYFGNVLSSIQKRDEEQRSEEARTRRPRDGEATKTQAEAAALATIRESPLLIDYYIRWKEDHGDEAEAQADARVRSSEQLYIAQVRDFAAALVRYTGFYAIPGSTLAEAHQRVLFLKDVIENKGGWRLFYVDGEPIRREADVHILFRLTWCNTPSDVNREVNNGRGPSDFEVSRGRFDKSLVEFKLAKNTALPRNLQRQAEIYKKASDAQHALKVIVCFTKAERDRVVALLKELDMDTNPHIRPDRCARRQQTQRLKG